MLGPIRAGGPEHLRLVCTLGVVFNNDPRAGYCWFLRAAPARAHHLRGVFGGVDGDARREARY